MKRQWKFIIKEYEKYGSGIMMNCDFKLEEGKRVKRMFVNCQLNQLEKIFFQKVIYFLEDKSIAEINWDDITEMYRDLIRKLVATHYDILKEQNLLEITTKEILQSE